MAFDMFYDITMNIYSNLTMIWRNERCGELFRNSKMAHHLRLTPIWRTSSHRSAFWRKIIWNVACPEGNMLSGDTKPIHLKLMLKVDYCANAGELPFTKNQSRVGIAMGPCVHVRQMTEVSQSATRYLLLYLYITYMLYKYVCLFLHLSFCFYLYKRITLWHRSC